MKLKLTLLCLLVFITKITFTQQSQTYPTVTVDLNSGIITSPLPFHEPFLLQGKISDSVELVTAFIIFGSNSIKIGEWKKIAGIPSENNFIIFCKVPLEANQEYTFNFGILRILNKKELIAFHDKVRLNFENILKSDGGKALIDDDDPGLDLINIREVIRNSMVLDESIDEVDWPEYGLFDVDQTDPIDASKAFSIKSDVTDRLRSYSERFNYIGELNSICNSLDQLFQQIGTNDAITGLMNFDSRALKKSKFDLQIFSENAEELALISSLAQNGKTGFNKISTGADPLPGEQEFLFDTAPLSEFEDIWDLTILENRMQTLEMLKGRMENLQEFLIQISNANELDHKSLTGLDILQNDMGNVVESISEIQYLLAEISSLLPKHESELDDIATLLTNEAAIVVLVRGTTEDNDIKTRSALYVGVDFGMAYSPLLKENVVIPFYGINFYLSPVNKRIKLREHLRHDNCMCHFSATRFARSFSISVGLTLYSIDLAGERKGLVNNLGLMGGVGWRINRSMRVSCGAIMFNKEDPNPLINGYSFAATGFVALSADLDIFGTLTNILRKGIPNY